MARLILDFIWRARWWYVVVFLQMSLFCGGVGAGFSRQAFFAGSMLAAFYIGPIITFALWPTREFASLPLSRLQLWRARWLLAIAVPATVTTAAKYAAMAYAALYRSPAPLSVSAIALSTIWDGAYCAAFLGVAAFMAYTPGWLGWLARRWPASAWIAKTVAVLLFLSGTFFSLVIRSYLATRPEELGPAALTLLAAFMAVAVMGYTVSGRSIPNAIQAPRHAQHAGGTPPRLRGLTGLRLLLVRDWATTTIMSAVMTPFMIGLFSFIDGLDTTLGQVKAMLGAVFGGVALRLDSAEPYLLVFMATMLSPRMFVKPLRHLRVLPLGLMRLNALMLFHSVVGWFTLWVVLLVTQQIMTGHLPPTWRIDLLCLLTGVSAVAGAIQQRSKFAGMLLVSLIIPASAYFASTPPVTYGRWFLTLLAGAATFGLAIWLNHRLLTRSSAIYRTDPWRMPFMPGQRP